MESDFERVPKREAAWRPIVRAFVARRPARGDELRSEPLEAQGGGWILRWDFWDVPFAAILDVLASVVFVPSVFGGDFVPRSLREEIWFYAQDAHLRIRINNHVLEDLDTWCRDPDAAEWYEALRQRWRPDSAQIVVVVDRVPDPRGPRHHFYAEPITTGDELFRAIVEPLYNVKVARAGEHKNRWLSQLKADGIYVMDLVTKPLIFETELAAERMRRIPLCVKELTELNPDVVLVCGNSPFEQLSESGFPGARLDRVPFPTGNSVKIFRQVIEDLRAAYRFEAPGWLTDPGYSDY